MGASRITRRRALKQLCGLVVLGGSVALVCTDSTSDSLRLIGQAWLRDHPATEAELLRMTGGVDAALPDADRFLAQRRADFAAGRIATVHGWVMAQAEVALCALAALEA